MAKATKNPPVLETKIVEVSPETYTLELSRSEAEYLHTLTSAVSGGTTESYAVYDALNDMDVDGYDTFTMLGKVTVNKR